MKWVAKTIHNPFNKRNTLRCFAASASSMPWTGLLLTRASEAIVSLKAMSLCSKIQLRSRLCWNGVRKLSASCTHSSKGIKREPNEKKKKSSLPVVRYHYCEDVIPTSDMTWTAFRKRPNEFVGTRKRTCQRVSAPVSLVGSIGLDWEKKALQDETASAGTHDSERRKEGSKPQWQNGTEKCLKIAPFPTKPLHLVRSSHPPNGSRKSNQERAKSVDNSVGNGNLATLLLSKSPLSFFLFSSYLHPTPNLKQPACS